MESFEAVEHDAIDSPVKDIKWYGKEDRTEESSIHDSGKGTPIVLRFQEYKFPPTLEVLPTKDQILTAQYVKDMHTWLWGDGLRMVIEPRVSITKEGCRVCFTCQATTGNSFLEDPKMLQEWIK